MGVGLGGTKPEMGSVEAIMVRKKRSWAGRVCAEAGNKAWTEDFSES